ncbi:MAG: hypothetical protein KKE57_10205 [Proteobacteria bacterium]|nr:hypothetical protein [Pseudomonadota bacterium]
MKETKEKQIGCEKTCGNLEVPTDEEVAALSALREIKNRVRELKKRRSELSSHKGAGKAEDLSAMEREMAELKMRWEKWEKRRKQAARERMILLGHEDPS